MTGKEKEQQLLHGSGPTFFLPIFFSKKNFFFFSSHTSMLIIDNVEDLIVGRNVPDVVKHAA